jgi:hypothetical protein
MSLDRGLAAVSSSTAAFSTSSGEDYQRALHRATGDEHLGDEEVAFFEASAHLVEGRDEGLEEDVHRVHPELQTLFGENLDLRRVSVERVIEQSGPDFLVSAHAAPPGCWHGSNKVVEVRGTQLPLVQPDAPTGPATALVRPEAVSLAAENDAVPGPLVGNVIAVAFLGATSRVTVDLGDMTVLAQLSTSDAAAHPAGTRVRLALRADPVLIAREEKAPVDA